MATLATIRGEVKRLLDDLNQTAYASAEGDGVTTKFPLPDQNIVGKTSILPATALTNTTQAITTDIINPPKTDILYVIGNDANVSGSVVISGTDYQDDPATDTITLAGTTESAGTTLFKTVDSITLPPYTVADTETVRVYTPHSVSCTIDSTANTGFIVDFDSGWVTFASAPAEGGEILWVYEYSQFNDDDILSALNNAIADIWAEVPRVTLDTTSLVPDSSTFEYALPASCARLIRVDRRNSATSPYEKLRNWRVVESGATKYLYLFEAPTSSDTVRLHYVPEPTWFVDDLDTLAGIGLPERAKWALIYMACFYLCEGKLLPRSRTNQFKNAEGVNVPKIYEVQRVAADFRTLAELEMRKVRLGAKRWS